MGTRFPVGLVLFLTGAAATASPFTPGNVLVTSGFNTPRVVFEYTREGSLVQKVDVPTVAGQGSSEYNRDAIVDSRGILHVFNGTFTPYISSYDPYNRTWSHHTISEFSINNNGTYGKLVQTGNYVFATDGGDVNGIVRLNTSTGEMVRFGQQSYNEAPIDITLARNGMLYSLNGEGSPSGRFIEVYDPTSMALIQSIVLPTSFVFGKASASRSIAVDEDGFIYLNQLYGPVYKLSPDGQVVVDEASYTQTSYVDDMDFSADGEFLMTQFDGRVTMLDSNLGEFRTFNTTNYYASGSFGSYIGPVPEPSSLIVLGFALLLLLRARRDSMAVKPDGR